jgi:NADPH2:quinone reductase
VLVQGATGVAGRLAVKVARLLGAGRIVATGRDDHQLREVRDIGADTVINTDQVGESAGPGLSVAAASLRTSGVEIYGAAKGLGPETMGDLYGQVVKWAQSGELTFDLEKVPLSDIEAAWRRTDLRGKRLVVMP